MALSLVMIPQQIKATHYVTLNDGRLHVFPDSCLSSMNVTEDAVVFTALDGQTFTYRNADVRSIHKTAPQELPSIISYEFNNENNYQVIGESVGTITDNVIHVNVIGIGKWLTAKFTLSDAEAVAWVDGVEQESEVSRLRFEDNITYIVGYPSDFVLSPSPSGSFQMTPYGKCYTVEVDFLTDYATSVPRIDINTAGGVNIVSTTDYLDAEIIIDGAGVFPSMTERVKVRGRGNSSWYPSPSAKNPYRLKFYRKVKPFGLTNSKNWVLLSNRIYGSMLTAAYGMKASSLIGTEATNHIIPVDLYINGTYKGHYNFTEKVGFSNNSIVLDDESAAVLLELDRYYDEPEGQKFKSDSCEVPVNIKHPVYGENVSFATLDDIKSRFNAFASAVVNGEDLSAHVDIEKLSRYLLANELICNKEIFHPKSVFCYYENILDNNSKLIFGPMWDLDWACGYTMAASSSYFSMLQKYDFFNKYYDGDQYEFFKAISKNKQVTERMYELIQEFMAEGLDELCDFCSDYYDYASPSLTNSRTAYNDEADYAKQAANAPDWFRSRAEQILERLEKDNRPPGDINGDGEINISDFNTLIDMILNDETRRVCDLNDDYEVTIADVQLLIDLLLST